MLHLISDRDPIFMLDVWTMLHKLTGVKLKMSTAYHPQTNGSSERTNKTVNQAICYHVDNNQKGWSKTLPHVRFAIMNTVNTSTGFSPFQLKTGRSLRIIPPLTNATATATHVPVEKVEDMNVMTPIEARAGPEFEVGLGLEDIADGGPCLGETHLGAGR